MRLLLDACVLYPTVMREMLLGAAQAGCFEPLWSDRILEEWARAAGKRGADQEVFARGEIALLNAAYPSATVAATPKLEARLWLPDPSDTHVLAAAIAGSADLIITLNAKDFPRNILQEEGLDRQDPDAALMGFRSSAADQIDAVARQVLDTARRLSGEDWTARALFKKARLPRFAKAVAEI